MMGNFFVKRGFALSFLFILFFLLPVHALSPVPTISSYVTDTAGVLSAGTKAEIESNLKSLESETAGVQFIVYVEEVYPKDYSLEEYLLALAEKNKVGAKGKDNGLLLYVAIQDREYRWETGYGLESTLNAALLGRISREYIYPNFRAGDYEKGISEAVRVTTGLIRNSSDSDIVALRAPEKNDWTPLIIVGIFLFVFFFVGVILPIAAAIRLARTGGGKGKKKGEQDEIFNAVATGLFLGRLGGGGHGGGSFGGGFSGGGGSFGGGGFSGRW